MSSSCLLSLQLPPTTVRILLNHFKWNKAKLMERYYGDSEEQEKMFKDAKVVSPLQSKAGGSGGSKKSSDSCECEICCLTLPKKVGTYARRIVKTEIIFLVICILPACLSVVTAKIAMYFRKVSGNFDMV